MDYMDMFDELDLVDDDREISRDSLADRPYRMKTADGRTLVPTIEPDSLHWRIIYNAAETLRAEALALMQMGYSDPLRIVDSLDEALEGSVLLKNNEKQFSELLAMRSNLRLAHGLFEEAHEDGVVCDHVNPTWHKGLQCMMLADKELGKHDVALAEVLQLLTGYPLCPLETKTDVLMEGFLLAPKVLRGFEQIAVVLPELNDIPWNNIIKGLADKDAWNIISILTQGSDSLEPLAPSSLGTNDVSLASLMTSCVGLNWKKWGQQLAIEMLRHGAKYTTFDPKRKKPLHAVFIKGTKTDTYELLKHIFLRYVKSDINQMDAEGNTLLHLACRETYPTQEIAIKLLLNNKLDPDKKNKAGKLPVDLLTENSSCRKLFANGKTVQPTVKQSDCKKIPAESQTKSSKSDNAGTLVTRLSAMSLGTNSEQFVTGQWKKPAVQKWLMDHGLTAKPYRILREMTGSELVEMKIIQNSAPEVFYRILRDQMQLNFEQILGLSSHIRTLQ